MSCNHYHPDPSTGICILCGKNSATHGESVSFAHSVTKFGAVGFIPKSKINNLLREIDEGQNNIKDIVKKLKQFTHE